MKYMKVITTLALLATFGCGDDQYDPQTWIDKLDEDHKVRRSAIKELRKLEDPVAIKPLVKSWRDHNYSPDTLQVIVELAREIKPESLHPDEVKAGFARDASWTAAQEAFDEAIDKLNSDGGATEYYVRNGEIAVKAIAEGHIEGSVPKLIELLYQGGALSSPRKFRRPRAKRIQLEAIRSLGKFGKNDKAVQALIAVMKQEYENDRERISFAGTAVIALENAANPDAIEPLLTTMYKHGVLYNQVRRAIIAIGKPAIPHLRRLMNGVAAGGAYEAMAKKLKFHDGTCEPVEVQVASGRTEKLTTGPGTNCQQPKQLEFKAASLLGDLHATEAVPDLLKELAEPAQPAFYLGSSPGSAPGPKQHAAVLESLRRIGDTSTQGRVLGYWRASDDPTLKAQAIEVYSWLATNKTALADLRGLMANGDEDPSVRVAAGRAYARIADSQAEFDEIAALVKQYREEGDEWQKKADPLIKTFDDAKKKFDDYEKQYGRYDQIVQKHEEKLRNQKASLATITDAAEKTEQENLISQTQAELDLLKTAQPDKVTLKLDDPNYDGRRQYRKGLLDVLENAAKEKQEPEEKMVNFRSSQHTAELNLVRIKIGMLYGNSPKDLIAVLDKKGEDIFKDLSATLRKEDWEDDKDKKSLHLAAVERAMITLAKKGKDARSSLDLLIADEGEGIERFRHLRSTTPIIRETSLHAMIQLAPKPCEKCVDALDIVIKEQSGNTTLKRLLMESRIARAYLARGLSKASAPASAEAD